MRFDCYVTRKGRNGCCVIVEADDYMEAAFAAYRVGYPEATGAPLVRYDAEGERFYVDGVEILVSRA